MLIETIMTIGSLPTEGKRLKSEKHIELDIIRRFRLGAQAVKLTSTTDGAYFEVTLLHRTGRSVTTMHNIRTDSRYAHLFQQGLIKG
jgi:hypothetical protein